MRAIVTGGNGFIGSHIVDKLCAEGHTVGIIDIAKPTADWRVPEGAKWMKMDVATQEAEDYIAEFHPAVIFHLAAKASVPASIADPFEDARTTVHGLLRVLEGARKAGARKIVYSSSAAVYGDPTVAMPIAETTPCRPISPYGVSKFAGEAYLEVYEALYGISYAALRYANVYGPRQGVTGEGGVVAIFAQAYANMQSIRLFGDGLHTRDYVYVDDVARANLLAACHEGSICCNISTGLQTSNADLIRTFEEVAARNVQVVREPERAGDIRHSALDPALAEKEFHYHALVRLRDGIAHTYDWMSGYFAALDH